LASIYLKATLVLVLQSCFSKILAGPLDIGPLRGIAYGSMTLTSVVVLENIVALHIHQRCFPPDEAARQVNLGHISRRMLQDAPSAPQVLQVPQIPQPVVTPVAATNVSIVIEEEEDDLEYIDGTEAPPPLPEPEPESSRASTPIYIEPPNKFDIRAPLTRNIPVRSLYHEPGSENLLLPVGVIHPNFIREVNTLGPITDVPILRLTVALNMRNSFRRRIGDITTSFRAPPSPHILRPFPGYTRHVQVPVSYFRSMADLEDSYSFILNEYVRYNGLLGHSTNETLATLRLHYQDLALYLRSLCEDYSRAIEWLRFNGIAFNSPWTPIATLVAQELADGQDDFSWVDAGTDDASNCDISSISGDRSEFDL
ncbi:hypothetical protein H0H92_004105, partial [Tricholoma furcatifolium]